MPHFLFKSVRFSLVWGFLVTVQVKIAILLRIRNGNIVQVDSRGMSTTACKGEIRTLDPILFHTPSPEPCLDCGKVILEGSRSGVRVRITREDACVVSEGS